MVATSEVTLTNAFHFRIWEWSYFDRNFIEICSQDSNPSLCLIIEQVPIPIILINDVIVYWRRYVSLGLTELTVRFGIISQVRSFLIIVGWMLGQPSHWTPVFLSMTSLETLPNVSSTTTAVWATWRWGARRDGCTVLLLEKQPLLWRYVVCTFNPYWLYLRKGKNCLHFLSLLTAETSEVAEILPRTGQGPVLAQLFFAFWFKITLKPGDHHCVNFVVTYGTKSCHGNLRYRQWQQSCQHGKLFDKVIPNKSVNRISVTMDGLMSVPESTTATYDI